MTLQSFLMYVSLWRANIPLVKKLRKESQLTLQRHRVSRAAALLRGLPSEPLAWEMLLSRVFWLQRVRKSFLQMNKGKGIKVTIAIFLCGISLVKFLCYLQLVIKVW